MSAVELFEQGDWSLRTVVVEGVACFVAADVCRALGHTNTSMAVGRHVDDEDRGLTECDTLSGRQDMLVVTESGLYALAFGSKLPAAKAFKRWVTREVLPQIRRTGSYAPQIALPTRTEALRIALEASERADAAEARAIEAEAAVAELAPAAEAWETLASANGDLSVREAAHILQRDHSIDIGQTRLFAKLRELGWVDKFNRPYQAHGPNGTGRVTELMTEWNDPDTGRSHVKAQLRVTPKGLADLLAVLRPRPTLTVVAS